MVHRPDFPRAHYTVPGMDSNVVALATSVIFVYIGAIMAKIMMVLP